jgi:Sulfatase
MRPYHRSRLAPRQFYKGRSQEKHFCAGWNFSCFSAHRLEQDVLTGNHFHVGADLLAPLKPCRSSNDHHISQCCKRTHTGMGHSSHQFGSLSGITRGARTPNLGRMAAEGARFTTWYGQASCTAGRASLITGRLPIRSALSVVIGPGDPNHLHAETPTIAEFYSGISATKRMAFRACRSRGCDTTSGSSCLRPRTLGLVRN